LQISAKNLVVVIIPTLILIIGLTLGLQSLRQENPDGKTNSSSIASSSPATESQKTIDQDDIDIDIDSIDLNAIHENQSPYISGIIKYPETYARIRKQIDQVTSVRLKTQ
jgi:hypothetical protein